MRTEIGHNRIVHFELLIRNGTLVTGSSQTPGDIGIAGGKIVEIGQLHGATADQVIDASGLWVMPGVIDTQVHFREPGLEHKEDLESGTRSAIMGGVTTIFEMPNTNPTTTSADALQDKLNRAEGRAWCDYAFFVGATVDNVDQLSDLEVLPGSPGIKIFMGSSTGPLLVGEDDQLRKVLANGSRRCPIHAEDEPRNRERKQAYLEGRLVPDPTVGSALNGSAMDHPHVRDATSALIATKRILALSEQTGRPVHILHLSTAAEIPVIAEAKSKGLGTSVEITPQHLWFSAPECYERLGSKAQMNPPVRGKIHQLALRQALGEGFFDVVGSDHAPHTLEEKAKPYPDSPSGMPGVQTLLPVMLTLVRDGLLDICHLVRLACENPATLYGIARKGRLERGFDADIVVVDPEDTFTVSGEWLESKCGWSPYEGERLSAPPRDVILRGKVAVQNGKRVGSPSGRPCVFDWKENL